MIKKIICQCNLSQFQQVVEIEPFETQKFNGGFCNEPRQYFISICNIYSYNMMLYNNSTSTNYFFVAEVKNGFY